MADQPTRKRRIVKRVLLALGACVLLLASYVASWVCVSHAGLKRYIASATAEKTRPVFAPIIRYSDSDLPGADALCHLWWFVNPPVMMPAKPDGFVGYTAPLSPREPPDYDFMGSATLPPEGMRFQ